jgi:hypothetical protein
MAEEPAPSTLTTVAALAAGTATPTAANKAAANKFDVFILISFFSVCDE